MELLETIIANAQDLARLIEDHELYKSYRKELEKMNNDPQAKKLFLQLVQVGEELNQKALQGEPLNLDKNAEHEMLQQELQSNKIVKDFIIAQKAYLELIQKVISKIKNPQVPV